jgi:hypothetical protein
MQLFASYMQTDMNTAVRYMHTYDTPGKYDVNTRPSTDITQPRPHMVTDAVIMLPQKGEEPGFLADTPPTQHDSPWCCIVPHCGNV